MIEAEEHGQKPSSLQVWLLASRPKTLPAGAVPVIIGGALAVESGVFHVPSFVLALTGSILIQIGANFANDLFDFLNKSDDSGRIGPLRVTQAGLVSPDRMKLATLVVFSLAILIGIYLVLRGGIPIMIVGIVSILLAVLYTGGPYPLGYLGLGDVLVVVFFGPVAVCGTYYVMALELDTIVVLAGIPPGMMAAALLTVNNLRDIDSDRRTGKRTLAVRFGRSFARFEYVFMIAGAALLPVLIYVLHREHMWSMGTALILLPAAITVRKVLQETSGRTLNNALAETGRLTALYGVLFSAGWLL